MEYLLALNRSTYLAKVPGFFLVAGQALTALVFGKRIAINQDG
jgi:hypothetical protein